MDARTTARWTLTTPLVGVLLYYALANTAYAVSSRPGGGNGVGLDILLVFLAFGIMAAGLPAAAWIAWRPARRRPRAAGCLLVLGAGAAGLGSLFLASAGASSHAAWVAGTVLLGWAAAQGWLAAAALRHPGTQLRPPRARTDPA